MLTRKQFLQSSLEVAAAAFGLVVLHGCGTSPTPGPGPNPDGGTGAQGDSGGPGGGTQSCLRTAPNVTIGENHGHVMVVTTAEISAGAAQTYHIQGTSDHDHTVLLSRDDMARLAQDRAITTVSSNDADHTHSILVACV